jgi:hypothetical protein
MRLLAACLVAMLGLAALAGCLGGSSPVTTTHAPPSATPSSGGASLPDASPRESPSGAPASPTKGPRVASFFWNGTVTGAGLDSDAFCCPGVSGLPIDSNSAVDFPVEANASAVTVTLTWSSPVADLDIGLNGADFVQGPTGATGHFWIDSKGQVGQPDSPAKLTVQVPSDLAGKWGILVLPKAAAQQAFSLRADVLYGGS